MTATQILEFGEKHAHEKNMFAELKGIIRK